MNNMSESSFTQIFKKLFLTSIFIIFIIPFSSVYGDGRVSANYSFILFPIFLILLTGSIKKPNNNIILIISSFCFIFLISLLYQFEFYKYLDRKLVSFIIFMSIFSYILIGINEDMVKAFKVAVVIFSCVFSFIKVADFFLLHCFDTGRNCKATLGSQRFGFIFILALWIVALYQPRFTSIKILKAVCFTIILLGIMNTFSRSSIIALFGSFLIFFYTQINLKTKLLNLSSCLKYIFIALIACFLLLTVFQNHFEFYLQRIFNFFLEGTFYSEITQSDSRTSLGLRIVFLKEILKFVAHNPFTGSGFLGCWIIEMDLSNNPYKTLNCSAHNQYADVLFRTGLFGFCFYIYLLLRVLKYLRTTNRDLFFGFIAILIYGCVHETFKLSQGAFVLTFLVGMTYSKRSNFSLFKNKIQYVKKID